MSDFQNAKELVKKYQKSLETGTVSEIAKTISDFTSDDYLWRGMHPFYEQPGAENAAKVFWLPLNVSFTNLQRREDIFFAGTNHNKDSEPTWVVSMGHFMGLFDKPWLGIRPTGKIVMIRYAEFHRVDNGKIEETALFIDVLSIMHQAEQYPLPPMTGAPFIYPGPKTHDGILLEKQPEVETAQTLNLVNKMIDDLDSLNESGSNTCPPELLEQTWTKDMIWYGPTGIGASYTIPRYQDQHQLPFRENLTNKVFNGHIARVTEGNYCGFFGWPNLNNQNYGGFLGLPASNVYASMRVVDIYRRENDKLVENWVFIDLLHYLSEQGLDVLKRNKELQRKY